MKTVLLAFLLTLAGSAGAQQAPAAAATIAAAGSAPAATADATGAAAAPDLYMEAMQAISEGRPNEASRILARMIAQGPRIPGEWVDLALLQCALGHGDEAEALFRQIEQRFDPPAGLRDLIRQQRAQGCKRWNDSLWSLQLGRGHDSNVNQGASSNLLDVGNGTQWELSPEYLPRRDSFTVLTGDYQRVLNDDGEMAFGQLHARQHDREHQFDTVALMAGLEHPWQAGRWRLRSVGMLGALTLGSRLYQQQAQLQLRATPPLKLPERYDFHLIGSATYLHYRTLSNFDSLTLELRGVLGYRASSGWAQASLGYQDDRANGSRPGGNRDGWTGRLAAHRRLFDKVEGELDWSRQSWHGQTPYLPGVLDAVRRQATRSLRASLSYAITPEHVVSLEWRRVHNRENISIFQYDSRQLQLNWRWYGR